MMGCVAETEPAQTNTQPRQRGELPLAPFVTAGASNFLIAAFGGLASIAAARLLGPSGRGEMAAAFVWMFLLCSLSQVGIPQAITYFCAAQPGRAGRYLRYALLSLVWQATAVVPAVVLYLLTSKRMTPGSAECILIVLPAVLLTSISTYAHSLALGLKQYRIFNTIRLLVSAASPVAVVVTFILRSRSSQMVVALFLCVQAAVAWYSLWTIGQNVPFGEKPLSYAEKRAFRIYSLKASLGNFSSLMNLRLDQFIISLVLTNSQLGLYAAAVGYSALLSPVAAALANISFSMIAAHGLESRHYSARRTIELSLVCTFVPGTLFCWLAPELCPLIFGKLFAGSILSARILCIAAIPLGLVYLFGDMIRALGRPEFVAAAEFGGAVATVAGLLLLLPKGGIAAAAWVSMGSYSIVLAILILSYRALRNSAHAA